MAKLEQATAFSPARAFICCVTLVFLVISLTHLADGIILLTDCPQWQGWAMAIGIDLMLIAAEYLMLTCEMPNDARRAAEMLCILVVLWSSYLNALAFTHGVIDIAHAIPIGLGISTPICVALAAYAMSRAKAQPPVAAKKRNTLAKAKAPATAAAKPRTGGVKAATKAPAPAQSPRTAAVAPSLVVAK